VSSAAPESRPAPPAEPGSLSRYGYEVLFRAVFEHTAVGVAVADLDGRFVETNPAFQRLVGYTADDLRGLAFARLTHPDDVAVSVALFAELAAGRRDHYRVEKRYVRKDGESVWVRKTLSLVRGPAGEPRFGVGLVEDVTERKRQEEELGRTARALEDQTRLLRSIVNSMGEGLVVADRRGQFVLFNPAAERILGAGALAVSPEEWSREYRLFLPDGSAPFPADQLPLVRALRGESVDAAEILVRKGDPPEDRWIVVNARPLVGDGGLAGGGVAVFRDVTDRRRAGTAVRRARDELAEANRVLAAEVEERKRVEEELRQAKAAAEAASRAKGEFLANMSHEIRTPLNGILGMTELALNTPLTAEQREYLNLVKLSADSLLTVINDILDFSKVEAGKLELAPAPFHLRDDLGDTLKTLALRAHEKGLELAYHVHPDVPDDLVGDLGRLRQVLVNLVGNAIKFTDRGEVTVHVRSQGAEASGQGAGGEMSPSASPPIASDCPLSPDSCLLHFEVRDTGIGIPAQKHRALFRAFEQADGSLARKYGGTGLGLAISAQLVALMGGRVWLESEPGLGSTFHFTARFGLAAPGGPGPPPEPVGLHGLPVLVVDDNEANRLILDEMLRGWRMRPALAAGSAEALDLWARARDAGEPFPLVLIDARMPGGDGFALAEQLRREEAAGVTVMMLTAQHQPADAARCRELGVAAYLTKPVKPSELLDAIQTALSREGPAAADRLAPPAATAAGPLRILVAEDNAVNRRLVIGLLEPLGHRLTLTVNGREALDALDRETFDLVLTDVQMPEMDGFELTAAIRQREQATGGHIPIVAMTAHALKGDRERCLAAGMDDYVSKPIRAADLLRAIAAVAPGAAGPLPTPAGPAAGGPAAIDPAPLLVEVGGNEGLVRELAGLCARECDRLLGEIRAAIDRGDAAALKVAAHGLKGALTNFRAGAAVEAAWRLECLGRDGTLAGADDAYRVLEAEVRNVGPALAGLAAGRSASPRGTGGGAP
jgi:two-component system sensor histidine kinase/response regulator